MTPVELALTGIYGLVMLVGYCLGRASGDADRAIERFHEQRRRDQLARDIEEGIAAVNSRPQLHSVADVVPMRRKNRDGAA